MDAYYAVWNWKDNQRVDGTSISLACGCKYNFKFSISIHVLFLLQLKNYTGLDGKQTFVNQSVRRKYRRTQTSRSRIPVGRPFANGHTLSNE
ncbi:LOW QUALITY PROTEIN: Hypothetical protein PHPALM_19850 [Phytophthora palmivora]|uniref:Uncharacterized protein n=1 Tax=Phytophthora palmivora TaxID=4796 RepID=A0A2P4XGC6_9STRA|nr:LOW QUALITY PROTEIN: Hypothetical protein PHPALM_19850 [Phytophthora palmivora]